MKIGLDIDNTICKTNMVASSIYEKYNHGKLSELPKKKQYIFIGNNSEDIFYDCPLFDNAKKIIDLLKNDGHNIYIISARSNKHVDNLEKITLDYLKNNNIYYDDIYFGHDSKIKIYEDLSLDVMLDDDFDVYEELVNNNHKAIMFSGDLNKEKDGRKVKSWVEFYNIIKENNI